MTIKARMLYFVMGCLVVWSLGSSAQTAPADLKNGFEQPPDTAKPWVLWMWLGGNISREGITADLEAMKRVGIGGAQIFNLGCLSSDPVTVDPIYFMTPQWRDMLHFALAEAARLGLQVDLNNDDGWNCGGTWITPALAMQTLTWSETNASGPGKFSGMLLQPPTKLDTYRDVAVLAIPASDELPEAVKTSSPAPAKWVQLAYDQPVTANAITVSAPAHSKKYPGRLYRCELQVSDDGNTFRSVRVFETGWRGIFRSGTPGTLNTTVGFEAVTGRFFRLVTLEALGKPSVDFTLQTGGRVSYWRQKAAFDSIAEHGGGSPLFTMPGEFPASDPGAGIPEKTVLNLTQQMRKNGEFQWEIPAGEWTILRIGYTPNGSRNGFATPTGSGLDCDKMNPAAIDAQFAGMVDKVIADAGPLVGKSLTMIHDDSLETDPQNWTANFAEEFKKRRGYDPIPWLPVMTGGYIVGTQEKSERFLWDVRRTVADLMIDDYFKHFQKLCHDRGLTFTAENTGRQQFLYDSISFGAACDVPMGEFWPSEARPRPDCKAAASAAHVYNLPFVEGESFTQAGGGRWMDTPFTLKAFGDAAFCAGVNRMALSHMALERWPERKPGLVWPNIGVQFYSSQTWWDQGRAWIDYISRCQYLLQQGRFVGDVAVLTGEGAPNSLIRLQQDPVDPKGKEDASTFTEAMLRRFDQMPALPPVGYDYDGVNPEAVLQMTVQDGRLVLPTGMSYRLLVLPSEERMTPALARKVRELVDDGALVVGPKPEGSPSLADYPRGDEEVRAIAQEVWGDCDGQKVTSHVFGKGEVFWGEEPGEIFRQLDLPPDFEYSSKDSQARLQYIHRRLGDVEIYFVSNQEQSPVDTECTFRVNGKAPELWYPDSGQIVKAAVYEQTQGRITVPLRLDPSGSVFVVFREPAGQQPIISVKRDGQTIVSTAMMGSISGSESKTALPVTASEYANVNAGIPGPGMKATAPDGSIKVADNRIVLSVGGRNTIEAAVWDNGHYELQRAQGAPIKFDVEQVPAPYGLDGNWELDFPAGQGAPDKVTLNSLISWSQHSDPGVKYFSGTATYRKEFEVPPGMMDAGKEVVLDLGSVKDFAEVLVNGKDLGVLWKPPFRIDVTGAVQPGKNTLEIKVTNLWPNRLIGDAGLPEGQRVTWVNWNPYKPDAPLLDSGLLGPVKLTCAVKLNLSQPQAF